MKYGVIDVGSNTVRLCVYDVSSETGKFKTIMNRKSMAGLAAYVKNGVFTDEGIAVAVESVRKCLKRAAYLSPARVDVFATAVLRNAANSQEAIEQIQQQTGCNVVLLSDDDEAHLGFIGASSKDNLQNGVLVDIGGGSSEVTLIAGGKDVLSTSLPQGSLSMYKTYVSDILPTQDELAAIRENIRTLLSSGQNGLSDHRVKQLFGVGGSVRALAEVNAHLHPGNSPVDISREQTMQLIDDVFQNRKAFIDAVLNAAPERMHTIVCGLAILVELFADFDADSLHVCNNGVREGYLIERML